MTREEAKALLLNISAYDIDTQRGMKKQEAIEMAIKALEQEPCDKCVYSTSEGCQYDDITETIPPFETSDVAISIQAVFEQIGGWIASGEYEFTNATDYLSKRIKAIPPVTPQPKDNIKGFYEIAGDLTNGDVIKALFPEIKVEIDGFLVRCVFIEHEFTTTEDWWNAPYKKVESEGKE